MTLELKDDEKVIVLDEFIKRIITRKGIYGYTQILEMLDNIAIEKHFIICPYCKRKD